MKKLLSTLKIVFLTLLFLGLSFAVVAQNPFIIKYTIPENGPEEVFIPLKGDYGVRVGSNPNNPIGVSFASTDLLSYTLQESLREDGGDIYFFISPRNNGESHPFNQVKFSELIEQDKVYVAEVVQWGDVEWSSFEGAFADCENLDITAIDIPNLSNVESMASAFKDTGISTVPNMDEWDMSNVTNMYQMFWGTRNFNQYIGSWDVSKVENMTQMFIRAENFNQDIGGWDVSNVTDMISMFYRAKSFNQDISGWDVSKVTFIDYMFAYAESFNQDIGDWDVSNVTRMIDMFKNAKNFNGKIGKWDVSNITNMSSMFSGAESFNQDIGNWDVSNVTHMNSMFYDAKSFNQNLGNWNLSSLQEANFMFNMTEDNTGLSCENFSKTIMGWALNPNTRNVSSNITTTDQEYSSEVSVYKDLLNSKWWRMSGAIESSCSIDGLPKPFHTIWDTEQTELTIPAIGKYAYQWYKDNDESNVSVSYADDSEIITLPTSGIYHIKVIPLKEESFAINFNNSGNKEDIIRISQWGSAKWASLKDAFYGCENLRVTATDIPNIEMVNDMSFAFANSGVTNILNIDQWDVSNVTNMHSMFANTNSFNANISTWDVSNVKRMNNMFHQASSFNQDLSSWNISSLESVGFNDISFANSGMGCKNFSKTINAWANLENIPIGIEVNAEGMELSYVLTDVKTFLYNEYNWMFIGDTEGDCTIDIGVSFENRDFKFTISPNPTQNYITITGLSGKELIIIYDINGNILIQKNAETSIEKMNLQRLASGIYFIKILINNNEIVTHKILKE